jgi:hypothetical protein
LFLRDQEAGDPNVPKARSETASPEHINPDTLDMLKEFADNDEIVIDAQSGSRRMPEHCHTSHTVERVLAAVSPAWIS